jgi:N-sulfoglucosamine sulfohydrolase
MERHTICRPEGAGYPMRSMRTAEFLYVKNYAPDRWPTGGEFLSSNKTPHGDIDAAPTKEVLIGATAATRFPKQVAWCLAKRPAEELYEVGTDPAQVKNLAEDARYAGQRDAMRARLKAYLEETGDPRAADQDPWQGYVYRQTDGYGASFNTSLPEAAREAARTRKTHKPE